MDSGERTALSGECANEVIRGFARGRHQEDFGGGRYIGEPCARSRDTVGSFGGADYLGLFAHRFTNIVRPHAMRGKGGPRGASTVVKHH